MQHEQLLDQWSEVFLCWRLQVNKVSGQTGLCERNYTDIVGVMTGHGHAADCRLDKPFLC